MVSNTACLRASASERDAAGCREYQHGRQTCRATEDSGSCRR
jgi:hypothetical protein